MATEVRFVEIVAAPFLHAGVAHLVGNLVALAVFVPSVLRVLGAWRSAAMCLLAGVLANQVAAALIERPVIGASGAVAAVMAAHWTLFPRSHLAPFIALWLGIQFVFLGIALDFADVAWPAHVVGAAIGFGFVVVARLVTRSELPPGARRPRWIVR